MSALTNLGPGSLRANGEQPTAVCEFVQQARLLRITQTPLLSISSFPVGVAVQDAL
jgi:hypothetical protein